MDECGGQVYQIPDSLDMTPLECRCLQPFDLIRGDIVKADEPQINTSFVALRICFQSVRGPANLVLARCTCLNLGV